MNPPAALIRRNGTRNTDIGFRYPSKDDKLANRSIDDVMKEIFAKSPAVEAAHHILGKQDEEPSLADKFLATTYSESDKLRGKARRMMDAAMIQYRGEMRRAHRFVLDNEFVRYATEAATVPAQQTLHRIQYATLPYELTWIEFDLQEKVRTLRRLHKVNNDDVSDVATRCGMLMQRINDTDAMVTLVSEIEGRPTVHLAAYFFSIVETEFRKPAYGCRPLVLVKVTTETYPQMIRSENTGDTVDIEIDPQRDDFGKASLWGYTKADATDPESFKEVALPKYLERHGDVAYSRVYSAYEAALADDSRAERKIGDLLLNEIQEFLGHMRWTITVLAMLNEVPVHALHVQPGYQTRVGHVRKPALDYHKVTLRLPKLHPIPFIERHLAGGSERRHRAHEVRAHWRTYLQPVHCSPETHDWEYDHEHGYRLCGKCMAFSRLIHEHIRGNAELGWVQKTEYVIKKA